MANVAVERQYLQDIADAIRARYAAAPAPTPLTVTRNGVYPAESAVGFGPVTVNVEGGGGAAVVEPLNVTNNGTFTPGTGVDGFNPVTVDVEPNLQSKTVTANGTVTPDAGYEGLSSVTVNVAASGYTVSAEISPAGAGTVTGTGNCTSGMSVTLTATAASGYLFTGWKSGDTVVSKSPTYTFSVNQDKSLTATFESAENIQYLTFSSDYNFSLYIKTFRKFWDGFLYYSTDLSTWKVWEGDYIYSKSYKLYLSGLGNTTITGSGSEYAGWCFSTSRNIECTGNIETLLDFNTVVNGGHPTMATYCFRSMFYNCTWLITAPALRGTTLSRYCYQYMFDGCISLTKIPALPATTLADGCYQGMFLGCTSLMLSTSNTGDYQYAFRIPTSGTGTSGTSSLSSMFGNTGGTFTGTPTINTTYYTTNPPVT